MELYSARKRVQPTKASQLDKCPYIIKYTILIAFCKGKAQNQMNELYTFLIVGVLISTLVAFGLFLHDGSTTIRSVTHNIENGKSVYDIEIVKNNNQAYDEVVDVNDGNITRFNDNL